MKSSLKGRSEGEERVEQTAEYEERNWPKEEDKEEEVEEEEGNWEEDELEEEEDESFGFLMSSPPQDNQEFLNKGKIGQDNYEHFIVMSAACVF